jgi:hypothetical protein
MAAVDVLTDAELERRPYETPPRRRVIGQSQILCGFERAYA